MPKGEEERVIVEFQRRRKHLLHNFVLCLALIALSLGIAELIDRYPAFLGIGLRTWSAIKIAQFIAGVVFVVIGFLQYRCPVCGEIPKGHDKYYLGVIIDPSHCPNCGARLS